MEVKINREIRNYTESMFFGLSLRQFIFSVLALGVAVLLYFVLKPYLGVADCELDVHPGCGTICRNGIHHLPRHDCRTVSVGVVEI